MLWLALLATLGVSSAQTAAPGLAGHAAKVLDLTGQVSVLRDSTPWALHPGDAIQPRQIILTGDDGHAQFQLSDGSTFEVFPNSRVTFRNNFDWKDLIDVWIGRVKVYIQKLGGQPNHNRVTTPTALISVRGTVFDVEVEDDDATTLVSVDEGQVAVEHKLLPRGGPRLLSAGEWIRVFKNEPLAKGGVDKGSLAGNTLRTIADVILSSIYRAPRSGGSGPSIPTGGGPTGPGPTLPGDHEPNTPGGDQPTAPTSGSPAPVPPPPPAPPGN